MSVNHVRWLAYTKREWTEGPKPSWQQRMRCTFTAILDECRRGARYSQITLSRQLGLKSLSVLPGKGFPTSLGTLASWLHLHVWSAWL